MSCLPFLCPYVEILWLSYLPASPLLCPEVLAGLFQALTFPRILRLPRSHLLCVIDVTALTTRNIIFYVCVFNVCLSIGVLSPRGQRFYLSFGLCCKECSHVVDAHLLFDGLHEYCCIPYLFSHIVSLRPLRFLESHPASMPRSLLGDRHPPCDPAILPVTVPTPPRVVFHPGHY